MSVSNHMDTFKLLSRSTKFSKSSKDNRIGSTPSGGRAVQPQLFGLNDGSIQSGLGKRKRHQAARVESDGDEPTLDFFDNADHDGAGEEREQAQVEDTSGGTIELADAEDARLPDVHRHIHLPLEERKRILKQHKLKATWLNPPSLRRSRKQNARSEKAEKLRNALFPNPLESLPDLSCRYGVSKRLAKNMTDEGYTIPTEVQLGALPLLLDSPQQYLAETDGFPNANTRPSEGVDLLTVAPTGSGKTLAFMIPLLHSLLTKRYARKAESRHTSAIILAPTKELAAQITNEGRKLVKATGLSVSQIRKGTRLPELSVDKGIEQDEEEGGAVAGTVVKTDIIVSTPGVLQGIISESRRPTWQIQHLILDEADVLLDPLFKEQTLGIWNSLMHPELRVSLWSATMGSNVEELAKTTIRDRIARLNRKGGLKFSEAPLIRLVVGLKDSAVPNVQHKLTYAANERGKLLGLRQLLHPASSAKDSAPALRPPFLVFTQTIERAIALHSELLYDIPVEAGGSTRIAVLHADLSDTKRDNIMTRFRRGDIWVLITTDLLSRGVDFRGVNGVVNYDIPSSSAAYVHRIGRTGRAGRDGGVAVTLYSKEDISYLKHVVNVVVMAEKQKGVSSEVPQWLLDALPRLSKNEKQNLKKRGIESRTARGQKKDPKAARRARISTKAGFVRRAENNRRGAVLGTRRRLHAATSNDAEDETDFGGFD